MATIDGCGPRGGQLLDHLVPLSAGITQPREAGAGGLGESLAEGSGPGLCGGVAEAVRQVVMAFQRAAPDLLEQLELRASRCKCNGRRAGRDLRRS